MQRDVRLSQLLVNAPCRPDDRRAGLGDETTGNNIRITVEQIDSAAAPRSSPRSA
jgi:hypothetical protein